MTDKTPTTEAPEWALREACKRTNIDWLYFQSATCSDATGRSIRAHALTIARHETPPVLQEQRERVARVLDVMGFHVTARDTREGAWDDLIPAAIQAMEADNA